jgi:DNA polymerase I-like protein with 3'-5' exonuclease and polymerase domains
MAQIITSYDEFRKCVPGIVRKINAEPGLSVRAAANPLLAFEEAGFRLAPAIQKTVERHFRFSPRERRQLSAIEQQLRGELGDGLDFDDPRQLERLLFQTLGLERPAGMSSLACPERFFTGIPGRNVRQIWTDPLEVLASKHPVVESLLAYRRLQVRRPAFATRSEYDAIRNRQRILPISRLRIVCPLPVISPEASNA